MTTSENKPGIPVTALWTAVGISCVLGAVSWLHLLAEKNNVPVLAPCMEAAYGYAIAVSFSLAQIGLGLWFLRTACFRRLCLRGLTRILFSFVIGFHLSYALLLLLALFPAHAPRALTLYTIVGFPAALFGALSLIRMRPRRAAAQRSSSRKKQIAVGTSVLLLILFFLPYLAQSALPNSDWDGDAFHLPQAKRFLDGGIMDRSLLFPAYQYPGALHLVYAYFLSVEAESAIIPFNLLISLGLVLAVFSMTARFWSRRAGLWAAAIWAGCNILWEVALTPRVDGFLAFFCFMAVYAFLIAIRNEEDRTALVPAGFALGTALGIKYTALFVLAVLGAGLVLYTAAAFRSRLRRMAFPALFALLAVLLPSGYWYARNFLQTGNPIYHFGTGVIFEDSSGNRIPFTEIKSEIMESGPSLEERNQTFRRNRIHALAADISYRDDPKNLFDFGRMFRRPEDYQRKPYHEINLLLLLFFALPLVSRKPDSIRLYGLGLGLFLIIGFQTYLLRYALPALPLMAAGAGITMSGLRFRLLRDTLTVILVVSCLRFSVLEYSKLDELKPLAWFSGNGDGLTWLTHVGYNRKTAVPRFIKTINAQIDRGEFNKTDRIYMVGEAKGYHLHCRYEPDTSRWATSWLVELYKAGMDYDTAARQLRSRGIKWIAYNLDYFRVVVERQTPQREPLLLSVSHLLRFVEEEAVVVYQQEDFVLVRLREGTEGKDIHKTIREEPIMAYINRIHIRNSL